MAILLNPSALKPSNAPVSAAALYCRLTSGGTEIVCDSWLLRKKLLELVTRQLHVVS
jgi:hypothetical protein